MNKKLFKNKEEHWAWVFNNYINLFGFVNEDGDWQETSIWEQEDLPKLKPFFDWDKDRQRLQKLKDAYNMPPEVVESYEFYKTKSEAATAKRERKDIANEIGQNALVEYFGFKPYGNDDDDDDCEYIHDPRYNAQDVPEFAEEFTIDYPCVMVYHLEHTWDRNGDVNIVSVDYVSLSEFN